MKKIKKLTREDLKTVKAGLDCGNFLRRNCDNHSGLDSTTSK
jgi:hypothetical protein